jgi:uncharacterized damage-inducible protein DinB
MSISANSINPAQQFLERPGVPGPFGALMDEYARAAAAFCRTIDNLPEGALDWERPSNSPDNASVRWLCAHVCGAARRYADYIRKARDLPHEKDFAFEPSALKTTDDVRARLVAALHYTEGAIDGLYEAEEATFTAIKFQVSWGPIYDPEMILEHAIVHLLRHRRQIERWPR